MTKEFWLELEKKLSGFYASIDLKSGTDKVSFQIVKSKMKLVVEVYINGVMRGAELKENQEKYWFKKTRCFATKANLEKYKKSMIRIYGKKEGMLKFEDQKKNSMASYYIPYFYSFASLKSQYKSRNLELRLMTQEEINQERTNADKSL